MTSRRWLLPTLIALPLVVVAATDVVRLLARRPVEDVALLEPEGPVAFARSAAVVDLRGDPPVVQGGDRDVQFAFGPGWGALDAQGRWSESDRFEVEWTVPVGGQTALFIEGRVDRNRAEKSMLVVSVNGRDAGQIELGRAMSPGSLSIAAAPLFAGRNRLRFWLVDPATGEADPARTALVRRLAVAQDGSWGFPRARGRSPVRRSADGRSVVIRAEGRLVLPFEVPASGSRLQFRYGFRDPAPGARCRVVVGRRYSGPDRFDMARDEVLSADQRTAGGFRQLLRDRGEPSALMLHVNAAAAHGGFVLKEPKIVIRPE